jgi:5,6-dimethylbenzimidazole synthase
MTHEFSNEQKEAVYSAIYQRRDMRHFIGGDVDPDIMHKLFSAAHAAPSVGMMQPWRFIRITEKPLRQNIYQLVEQERIKTAEAMGERSDEFTRLKVEGVRECAELIVVGLMDRRDEYIFGRRTLPEMDMASVSCAIQNMWLAARVEGLGMGWVSLFDPDQLRVLLNMPEDSKPIAVLCLGQVERFYDKPMLQEEGWIQPGELNNVIMENCWELSKAEEAHSRR